MSAPQQRRRPIAEGDIVEHCDGRSGRVLHLGYITRDGLPAAEVQWFKGEKEIVALGYICRASAGASENGCDG